MSSIRVTDYTGQKFNRLTAVRNTGNKTNSRSYLWEFSCDCGRKTICPMPAVKFGSIKSCGCLKKEIKRKGRPTHGKSHLLAYRSWQAMKSRCLSHPSYVSNGITYCEKWESFEGFLEDMGNRPSPKHSLGRIDNNGNYCKENCRWATSYTQNINKRNTVILEFDGRRLPVSEWALELGLNRETIKARIKIGWSVEKALTTPKIDPKSPRLGTYSFKS